MKNPSSRHNESALKALFLQHLLRTGIIRKRAVISNEYQVDGASRRADLAIATRHSFIGVEIKSEFDSLSRLEKQLEAYLKVFDDVFLVVADKHVPAALEIAAAPVAVFGVSADGCFSRYNPNRQFAHHPVAVANQAIVRALPKAVLLDLVGRPDGKWSRQQLMSRAVELPNTALRSCLIQQFQKRYGATSEDFWKNVMRRKVLPDNLASLSRFNSRQNEVIHHKLNHRLLWEEWLEERNKEITEKQQAA